VVWRSCGRSGRLADNRTAGLQDCTTKKKNMKKDKRILIPRDEFEEEASEGLGRLSREEAEADLRELKARMERRVARPRAIWLPAAAAVVILLVASGILVTLLRDRPAIDYQLAQNGPEHSGAAVADKENAAVAGEIITDTALIAMAPPLEKKGHGDTAPAIAGIAVTDVSEVAADEVFVSVEENAGVTDLAEVAVVTVQVAEAEDAAAAQAAGKEKAEMVQAEEVIVQAVPQAKVTAMKTQSAADARDRGKAAAGRDNAATSVPASPLGGWESYREWITRNLKYPEGVLTVVRQEVMVSFTVQADSTISGLKAESSPGELFTWEVFRLLREGPKWVPASIGGEVKAEKVVVRFVFE